MGKVLQAQRQAARVTARKNDKPVHYGAPRAPSAPSASPKKQPKASINNPQSQDQGQDFQPVTPDVQDSQYWAQMAKLQFQRTQQVNDLNQQQSYADTDYNEALRRMAQQHPTDQTNIKANANKQGLFYSGTLGKQLGDNETQYQQGVGDTTQNYTRASAARQAARAAIEQGAPADEAALLAEAVDRQSNRDVTSPPAVPIDPAATGPIYKPPKTTDLINGRTGLPRVAKIPKPVAPKPLGDKYRGNTKKLRKAYR